MTVVAKLGYMLVMLAVGLGARRAGVLDDDRRDRLNAFAFYVALPALIFSSIYREPLSEVVTVPLLIGLWIVLVAMAGLALFVHRRREEPVGSVAVVQSYHSNMGYLGLPLVASAFGGIAAAKAGILLGAGALTQIPLTILVLATMNDADADVLRELRGVLTMPVILALVTGIAFSSLGWGVPGLVRTGLGWLSELALPIALLCVGASLSLVPGDVELPVVGSVIALKVFVMPVVALAVFTLLGAAPTTVQAGVVMVAAPTAVSTYVYVTELGGDPRLASMNVFATTVVSVATLLAIITLVF